MVVVVAETAVVVVPDDEPGADVVVEVVVVVDVDAAATVVVVVDVVVVVVVVVVIGSYKVTRAAFTFSAGPLFCDASVAAAAATCEISVPSLLHVTEISKTRLTVTTLMP